MSLWRVELLEIRHPNIKHRVQHYTAIGLMGVLIAATDLAPGTRPRYNTEANRSSALRGRWCRICQCRRGGCHADSCWRALTARQGMTSGDPALIAW